MVVIQNGQNGIPVRGGVVVQQPEYVPVLILHHVTVAMTVLNSEEAC